MAATVSRVGTDSVNPLLSGTVWRMGNSRQSVREITRLCHFHADKTVRRFLQLLRVFGSKRLLFYLHTMRFFRVFPYDCRIRLREKRHWKTQRCQKNQLVFHDIMFVMFVL